MIDRRFQRLLYLLAGIVAAVGGMVAITSHEVAFFGRSTGRIATYAGADATAIGLLWLGVAGFLIARAVPTQQLRRGLTGLGVVCLIGAFVVQLRMFLL